MLCRLPISILGTFGSIRKYIVFTPTLVYIKKELKNYINYINVINTHLIALESRK
jgi:hypothetical protein